MKASTHCIAALKLALGNWFQNTWNASLHGHLPKPALAKVPLLTNVALFGRLFPLLLQQPHEVCHAGVVLVLGRLWGRLVFPKPSSEPIENHVRSVD
jgi:hypothetical protein